MRAKSSGFTLIELMIIVVIIGILTAIALPRYSFLITKSKEGVTKGNLASLRSSLSIYFGDNDQIYPSDDLSSLAANSKYIPLVPVMKTPGYHLDSNSVTAETIPSDSGQWSYDNDDTTTSWGVLVVGCLHQDAMGGVWTTY